MADETDLVQYDTVRLEKLKVGLQMALPEEILDPSVDFALHEDFVRDTVMMGIRGFVWSEKLTSEKFRWPADWWQAFKAQWFPQWAKRRWPVRYEVRQVDVRVVYPDYRPAIPDQRWKWQVFTHNLTPTRTVDHR